MKLSAIKSVTIIAPLKLKDDLVVLLRSAGISGYTYYYVFGGGEKQLREIDSKEIENVKFRILVPHLLAYTLMQDVAEKYFEKEKVILFAQDANVMRFEKFDQVEY
jgi:nitrogen regulatory protein PII